MYRSTTASVRSSPAPVNFQPQPPPQPEAILLTAREKEVLKWGVAGKSSWEIAQICACSEAGVNYHFSNIRRKFGVRSRWAAMAKALEQGLIQSS
ncbi:LuxR family transcriptional regulator [Pseudomonas sp. PCH199]|uniref:response regulator transcription factor n=1 Tax=unclassified Pseudomonas TaxID=196821 RepID=UPI000BD186F5|nr:MULTISPECIES: LuxR family transcriptional regulator [unclassified Pseudomonas]MCW8275020.1 LuxR family transcriptional regulator [Pseudomonas sp. PCH199]PAM84930.1 helix-turn-helix transcriptional regulator [Pseudomonas sp. ERMR1:02]